MNDLVIDAFDFCRSNDYREGELPVAQLPRLAAESVGKAGTMRWSAQGATGKHGHPQLGLVISGDVSLVCQRCLGTFVFGIESSSVLVLAPDEASADEIDAQLGDEDVEVIVGSHDLDLRQLIEDEALLAIPLSPKHDACPGGAAVASDTPELAKESPFAVLKNLKK